MTIKELEAVDAESDRRRQLSKEGHPVDAEVLYNPKSQVTLEKNVRADPEALLVHELAHAYQIITGTDPHERKPQELFATGIENIHRHAMDPTHESVPQRTVYGEAPKYGWIVDQVLPDSDAIKAKRQREREEDLRLQRNRETEVQLWRAAKGAKPRRGGR